MDIQLLHIFLVSRYPKFSFEIGSKQESGIDDIKAPDKLISLGFEDMSIIDPFSSSCGRFSVNPTEAYGLKEQDAQLIRQHNKVSLA